MQCGRVGLTDAASPPPGHQLLVIIYGYIIVGLSLLQSIPPTTANKQTQAQKKRGSMARKPLGANAKSYRLKLKLNENIVSR